MIAYYFAPENNKLRYGDNREIVVGESHTVDCKPKCCERGLHASLRPIDALKYAPGNQLYIVNITGSVDSNDDKICGTSRLYIDKIPNCGELLREFSRLVALKVMLKELPNANPVIFKYLRTGDIKLRSAAESAAESASWSAAESAAESAAWSAAESAAWSAAESASRSAAWSAAWSASRSAAWSAAWSAAESAAESASWSAAESAAESAAWSAAESAAWSAAESASRSAAESSQNEILLGLISKYKTNK